MFIRPHKHTYVLAIRLEEKVREIIQSHCTLFFHLRDPCFYGQARRETFKRLIFEVRCVELRYDGNYDEFFV